MAGNTIADKSLNISEANLLRDMAYIIGITHDFGKATKFFQKYITETDEKKRRSLKAMEVTHHGLLSAFFTYSVIKEYLKQYKIESGISENLPIISFLAVKRHHGNFLNAMDEISDVDADEEDVMKTAGEQIESIDMIELEEILSTLISERNINLNIDISNIKNYILNNIITDIAKERRLLRHLSDNNDIYPYFVNQFLYSILIDADKTDAGLDGILLERQNLPANLVDLYREAKHFTDSTVNINSLRNQIYDEATGRIEDWNLDNKIISLNVPTGTGKTLTALSVALKLGARLERDKNIRSRIIYSLPFLSIIDQNYGVFDSVIFPEADLESKKDQTLADPCDEIEDETKTKRTHKDSRLLLKHHHLADVSYEAGDAEYEADKSLLLMEGWNSEIIVTTFWQLFNTLFSNRNKLLRKFNKLTNAIIILDEVQAMPHRYWRLIHDALMLLCNKFNSYVILITATQPLIFEEGIGEIQEIAKRKEEYFRSLDRIDLIPIIEKALTLDEFKEILKNDLENEKNKDFLIVLNTINSAKSIYDYISGLGLKNTKMCYLSTSVVPKDRLKRINQIKETKDSAGHRKVIVSTQLIEAGVDIDADRVYRDFAPMDSINQVAGRCNRGSSKIEKGLVKIFVLKDDKQEFYKYIYDPFLVDKTLEILGPIKEPIKESKFLELNNMYFRAIKRGMSDKDSKDSLDCITGLAFKDLSEKFKLIEDDIPAVNVFVELDETAEKIWKKYQEFRNEKDNLERTKKYLKIRKCFSDYLISAPKKFAGLLVTDDSNIGYISRAELSNFYDEKTGFKMSGAGGGSIIL
ncbi:MAG: CRISPR-associated nuclease/helicase Cas3 [Methanosaeta sp. PtaU1.Bin060]|nr:MAG: CRISPR-associated nuclease/helicase Cas3 [Methanosaeta sp. PtaU1.Bin060]